jgi:ATP/ADP translocase
MTAMVCAAAVSAQFIAGKATRDALYLGVLPATTLPLMVTITAGFSLALVALSSLTLRRVPPAVVVPAAFAANAALLILEWAIADTSPEWAARAVFLHFSGLGPMLGSGFWLIATDLFDPRSARRHFGQIAGVGTLSGLAGALVAERVASLYGVASMLPVLAALSLLSAWQVRRLARLRAARDTVAVPRPDAPPGEPAPGAAGRVHEPLPRGGPEQDGSIEGATDLLADSPQSGLRALAQTAYLRNLAAIVFLGTVGAVLVDYVFKVRAVEAFGQGDTLLGFFAAYYAATSLVAFVIQTTSSRFALERLGLALTTSTPSIALALGGLAGIAFPGISGAILARSGESVFRGSLFRTGYELFFTPLPSSEKRAAKSIIDVGFDRLGDAIGGVAIRLLLLLPLAAPQSVILAAAAACGVAALLVARQLNRGYVQTLERSLINRAIELDLDEVRDVTTRSTIFRTMPSLQGTRTRILEPSTRTDITATADPIVMSTLTLRSRDRDRIVALLRQEEGLPGPLVPHVIPLLAWDPVSEQAGRALRKVVEEHVGTLTDALIDVNQPFAVRRRLARVFSTAVSQRAADGLVHGLEDLRFEVRYQCGRSLAAIMAKNNMLRIDAQRIFTVVRREVNVGRPVWESHRLLDQAPEEEVRPFVDEFIKDRTSQSLGHVFTLLSLVLPSQPLQIAYRGLHTNDPGLRGTALEYLEEVLPPDIRARLWPFLGDRAAQGVQARSRDEILADLLRSNESIELNLKELRRRAAAPGT